MLPESPPDSGSEPCSPPQIPGKNPKQYRHAYMIGQNKCLAFALLYETAIPQKLVPIHLQTNKKKKRMIPCYNISKETALLWTSGPRVLALRLSETCFVMLPHPFFPPDVHFGSDLSTEQLAPGLHAPTGQTAALFCHLKAPPSSQYDLGNSMKHIKTKSPAAAQLLCDSSIHCPYSSPAASCVQTAAPPVPHAPMDAIGGYAEATTSSTSPCLLPHGVHAVCVDPCMASKPGLNAG